jgi:hypothetical protein
MIKSPSYNKFKFMHRMSYCGWLAGNQSNTADVQIDLEKGTILAIRTGVLYVRTLVLLMGPDCFAGES